MSAMNPDGGYSRLYRRMWQNPAFRSKQEAAVFAWMISAAQWQPYRMATRYGPVALGVGELLIAERELAEDFGLHRNTLRALLQRMADEGIIERFLDRAPHRAGTIVRIKNYAVYQCVAEHQAPAQDRNGTAEQTEHGPQEDRIGTKNKEEKKDKEGEGLRPSAVPARGGDLFTEAPPKPGGSKRPKTRGAAKPNPVGALRDQGVEKLAELTGRPVSKLYPVVQLWIRDAGGDEAAAEAVLGFIAEAHSRNLRPCHGFITDRVQRYAQRAEASVEPVPETAGGWVVADVVGRCGDISGACLEGLWPEFPRIVADALAAGADPDEHIYPVMRGVAGQVTSRVESAGFFAAGIRNAMGRRRAA